METENRADKSSSSDPETPFPNLSLGSILIVSWTPVVKTNVCDRTPTKLVFSGHAGPDKILQFKDCFGFIFFLNSNKLTHSICKGTMAYW